VTLDGEGVVCREDRVSDFDRLRAAVGRPGSRDAFLYAFDLLEIDGEDLRRYEWHVRLATLRSLIKRASPGIRLCEHLATAGSRSNISGRSPDWIKVKNPNALAAIRLIEG
jgi:bifunctional non-homologous end joining protein LigD